MNTSRILIALASSLAFAGSLHSQSSSSREPIRLAGEKVEDPASPLELAMEEFDNTGHARVIPATNPGEFITFPFGYSRPLLRCGALKLCQIELQLGEVLTDNPLFGDRERWDVDQTWSGKMAVVVVKPKECDIRTNLLLITDRRRYVVDLEAPTCASTRPSVDYTTGIRFWYPGEPVRQEEAPDTVADGMLVDLRNLNTNYRWQTSRNVTWNPVRVFDDGIRSMIQFGPEAHNGEFPVLYAVADDGTRELVNSIPRPDPTGDYLIADRVLKRAVLVLLDGSRERRLTVDNMTLLRRER